MNGNDIYEAEIAPELMRLAERCKDAGMSLLAVVEYAEGQTGETYCLQPSACTAMRMIQICAQAAPNMDRFVIAMTRYCREAGIDTSGSIVMRGMFPASERRKAAE